MSLNRYNTKRDATEPAILKALANVGADYLVLKTFDVLVLYRGELKMLDCKSHRGRLTESQKDLVKRGWPLRFAKTPEEALRAIGAIR